MFTAFNVALRLSESDQQLLGAVRSAMRLRISGRHK
jgi:hypothetical protein